jgi:hypothetical protein
MGSWSFLVHGDLHWTTTELSCRTSTVSGCQCITISSVIAFFFHLKGGVVISAAVAIVDGLAVEIFSFGEELMLKGRESSAEDFRDVPDKFLG